MALPPDMRVEYASKLTTLLPSGVAILLIAFDYPQNEMQGPPFSVQNAEVNLLYGNWCEVKLLANENVLEQELHFKQRGLTKIEEHIYRLLVR